MRQGQTRLEQRIKQVSLAADQAIDAYTVAYGEVLAHARQSWERLTDYDLITLAQQQEAWICGRLPQAGDIRAIVLKALEHATEMRILKEQACGHDQVVRYLDRLAALVSQRKTSLRSTKCGRDEGIVANHD